MWTPTKVRGKENWEKLETRQCGRCLHVNQVIARSSENLCLKSFNLHFSDSSYIINSSFTAFPLKTLPLEIDFFVKEDPWGSPWASYRYSYAHAHITQIENAWEHCVNVTDPSGWQFSTTMYWNIPIAINTCVLVDLAFINVNLVKKGSFRINAKLMKENLIVKSYIFQIIVIWCADKAKKKIVCFR